MARVASMVGSSVMCRRTLIVLACVLAGAALTRVACAESANVQTQRPPHYVGEPLLIRVTAEGFEEEPQPECLHEGTLSGGVLHFAGASPRVSSMVHIMNGRRTERRTVSWSFDFHATFDRPGMHVLGPFVVKQGGREARTGQVRLTPRAVPIDPDMSVSLGLPEGPVFPGQRVHVEIEWAYGGDVKAVDEVVVRSRLFDLFSFEDEPVGPREPSLPLATAKGIIRVGATVTGRKRSGREWFVLTARRTLIPERPGVYELPPVTASVNKVTRWQRTFFGERVAAATERVRAEGQPRRFVVKELPRAGRPESFAGAIGHGFTLEAAADRTVVRVGDPITLTLTLRGDGNLENAGLPSLSADGGLDPVAFRLPDAEPAGVLDGKTKTFEVTVRVEDPSVTRIPGIAYSWFDTDAGTYETTRSDPIAMQVKEARTVAAGDVVSAAPTIERPPTSEMQATSTTPRRRYDVTGADLAVRREPSRVLVSEASRFGGKALRIGLYVLGGLLLALAVVARRRAEVDPELLRRRALAQAARVRLGAARSKGLQEGCRSLAASLRSVAPVVSQELKVDLEATAAECDAAAYAPNASGTVDPALLGRAQALLGRATKEIG